MLTRAEYAKKALHFGIGFKHLAVHARALISRVPETIVLSAAVFLSADNSLKIIVTILLSITRANRMRLIYNELFILYSFLYHRNNCISRAI